ncbi:MAG: YkvA family protein [Rudaea sp.]
MRVTIELDQADIERFVSTLERSRELARTMDEVDVIDAAKQTLDTRPLGSAPEYVRKRLVGVQRFILMLEDDAWALPNPERREVLTALVYFSDPEDLIPDDVEVIGQFDDAVVLELVLRRLRHVLKAYDEFCVYREQLEDDDSSPQARLHRAGFLARRRDSLRVRVQRQTQRKLGTSRRVT